MANMKELTIKVGVEGEKDIKSLRDSIKDIKIEALSAKDMMQDIADKVPGVASKIE